MHSVTAIAMLSLCILCILTYPTIGMSRILNSDLVYFPDQAEYVKLSMKCPENTILWPGTRRCYREGEQGPCNIGRILVLDRKLLKPYCKDTVLKYRMESLNCKINGRI